MNASDPEHMVANELLTYWRKRPHASDTLEGICNWWLSSPFASPEQVEATLAGLISLGVVVTTTAADGRMHYRLANDRSNRTLHVDSWR